MTTVSSNGRIAYMYDGDTDTWYPVAGSTNTSANFTWTGTHDFDNEVTFIKPVTLSDSVIAVEGVNSFVNYNGRDAALGSTPAKDGILAFVKNDNSGNLVNDISYSSDGVWFKLSNQTIDSKTASYPLELKDVGRIISVNSSSDLEVTVPAHANAAFPIGSKIEIIRVGAGNVSIIPVSGSGVTIRSKNNNTKLSTQYVGAMLLKIATNEWILIGDLKA